MTPKDALIEKMARAIASTFNSIEWSSKTPWERRVWLEFARAAYEAEHEEEGK